MLRFVIPSSLNADGWPPFALADGAAVGLQRGGNRIAPAAALSAMVERHGRAHVEYADGGARGGSCASCSAIMASRAVTRAPTSTRHAPGG